MALLKVICWALIFIIRIRFPPGKSLATILNKLFVLNVGNLQGRHKILAMSFACTVGILTLVLHHNVENLKKIFSKSQIPGVRPGGQDRSWN